MQGLLFRVRLVPMGFKTYLIQDTVILVEKARWKLASCPCSWLSGCMMGLLSRDNTAGALSYVLSSAFRTTSFSNSFGKFCIVVFRFGFVTRSKFVGSIGCYLVSELVERSRMVMQRNIAPPPLEGGSLKRSTA